MNNCFWKDYLLHNIVQYGIMNTRAVKIKNIKIMKRIITIAALLFPFCAFAQDDITGVWLTENDEAKVQVYKVGNEYFGKVIWLKEPNDKNGKPKKDKNNPDPDKRNNPAIGILLMKNVKYADGKWKGIIYGPRRGKEAKCTFILKEKDILEGTVTYSFFTGSKTWRRVK
jgi:uncharacterized protein (DUF2147 family)